MTSDLPARAVPVGADLPGEGELVVPSRGVSEVHFSLVSLVHLGVGAFTHLQGLHVASTVDHIILVHPGILTVMVGLQDGLPVLVIAGHAGEHLVCRVR